MKNLSAIKNNIFYILCLVFILAILVAAFCFGYLYATNIPHEDAYTIILPPV